MKIIPEILTRPIIMPKWYEIHVNLGRIEPPIEQCIKGAK
jgi:hypothetical protein